MREPPWWRLPADGDYCEILAFDRVLSDGEMRQVEAYLAAKWQVAEWSEGNPPAEFESGFGEGTSLAIETGASVNLGVADVSVDMLRNNGLGGSITGNLTIRDEFVVDAQGRTSISPIAVTGNVAIGPSTQATILGIGNLERGHRHNALTATDAISGDFATVNGLTSATSSCSRFATRRTAR